MNNESYNENDITNTHSHGNENPENIFEPNYSLYQKLGGIINEKDYESILERAQNQYVFNDNNPKSVLMVHQAEAIANYVKIELHNSENKLDPKIAIYTLLRTDPLPTNTEHHYSQMSDQRLFVEAVRMVGDVELLEKLIAAYPNINFVYGKEEKVEENIEEGRNEDFEKAA